MSFGVVGLKCGMSRIFTSNGDSIPVSVIYVCPNRIVQIKTNDIDGYEALQITKDIKKRSHINNALSGHFSKAGVEPGKGLWEFRFNRANTFKLRQTIDISIFKIGDFVDVTGISKGKGFQGVVKRHNFKTQDASHGNSLSHRVHGSTGQNQTPGRVFKNKKMAGHMGNVKVTIQHLKIIKLYTKQGLLLLKGCVPGSNGCNIVIKYSNKLKSKRHIIDEAISRKF
jgi:large subunit ribosomal protein L3